ncbi:MAG TPA: PLDc N-terminal domain-containing protein [Nocardioidaceae bacterium]|nr:PLDc N-terminal domain-containing protein [Nocardioidaceae bacterium]
MARLGVYAGPVILVLWIFCVFDVITSREDEVRHLPKWGWLVLVLLFPLVGSVVWLAAGRPRRTPTRRAFERPTTAFPEYDRPGRATALEPEADEEFLRRCRERAEEQRRRHREGLDDASDGA